MPTITLQSGVPEGARVQLGGAAKRLRTLEDVVRWGLAQPTSRVILDVVIQDEFTHDVVLEWRDGLFVVFDTT